MTTDNSHSPSASADSFDLRALLHGLFEAKWHILVSLVVVVASVAAWTLRQPKIYEATCSIEYDPNPPRPLGTDVQVVSDPVGGFLMTREFIETQNHIITSRTVAEMVVRKLALHRDPSFLGIPTADRRGFRGVDVSDAALVLQSRVSIEGVRDTRLILVHVQDQDPQRAAALANALADSYVEKTLADRLGTTVTALEWLSSQLDTLRRQLETSELALHEFKRDNNVLSVSLEDRQNIVANDIQRFNQALTDARTKRIGLAARLTQLRIANREDPSSVHATVIDANPRVVELRQRLAQTASEQSTLALRYGAEHPRMQEAEATLVAIRTQLRAEIDGVIESAESDAREMQSIEGGLRGALDEANTAGLELNLREIEYSRLQRQRENNTKIYNILLERTTETDLTRMLRVTYVRIVDRALTPLRPVGPRVMFNLALAVVIGLALGLALAFALSRLDRRIRSLEELEGLGVQLLGVVPATIADTEGGARPIRARSTRRGRRGDKADDASRLRDTLVHTQPLSSFSESVRGLRTNLTFMFPDAPLRSIVVTSAGPGEGKTTVAANLSIALAQSGKRVLLIDTDLRRPRIHRVFGIQSATGTSSILVGDVRLDETVSSTDVPNLWVVGCGPIPPNPAELLHTERFRKLIEEALQSYDRVVFDSPPLGAVADAAVISAQVSGTILVVQADRTTRDAARSALRQLQDVGARYVGAVLNGVDPTSRRYGQGGYYYSYGRGGYYAEQRPSVPGEESTSSPRGDH